VLKNQPPRFDLVKADNNGNGLLAMLGEKDFQCSKLEACGRELQGQKSLGV
jgi:hypothetical protein